MRILRVVTFLVLFTLVTGHENLNSHVFPRPFIIEYPENTEPHHHQLKDEVQLQCTSWRFSVETNNLGPWKTIPEECGDYVRQYIEGGAYKMDIDRVSDEAGAYAKSVDLGADEKDVLEVFDSVEFDKWVEKGMAPAIGSSLKLYHDVLSLGFKVFLLTGRGERHRGITVENLMNAGFRDWHKLILRGSDDHGKTATTFKSERRNEMVEEGFRIVGNSGDQWSDLLGSSASNRSFKLPNPMYYIP